jgi:DNA-binding NarL/FixJ family response regulator
MINVLLVEDHAMVRAGLRALLEKTKDIHVLGEAANGQEGIDMAQQLNPDVIVMDIMMPRMNGIQAAEHMRNLKLKSRVLLLSMHSDQGLVHQALQSGIKGYVLKSSVSEELLQAIRAISRGETYLNAEISSIAVEQSLNPHPSRSLNPLESLSPREKEILQLITEEYTSVEIAKMLSISEKTVEKHRANIMEKLNVHNIAGLVRLAIKHGLVNKD